MKNYTLNTIALQAKEWFDKVNGNSYFAAVITLNFATDTEKTITIPFTYGYDSAYLQEALHILQTEGYLPTENVYGGLIRYCRENNIDLRNSIKRGCLKRELTALTQYA